MTALEIIQWLKEDGHINNKQAGILRRAILDRPEGHWEAVPLNATPKKVLWRCENCKNLAENATPYCPWCSADMRSQHAKEGEKIVKAFWDGWEGHIEKTKGGNP